MTDFTWTNDDKAALLSNTETALFNGSTTISGVFDNGYEAVEVNGMMVEGRGPSWTCNEADAPSPHGKTLLYGGTTYTIYEPQPDGQGFTVLLLKT